MDTKTISIEMSKLSSPFPMACGVLECVWNTQFSTLIWEKRIFGTPEFCFMNYTWSNKNVDKGSLKKEDKNNLLRENASITELPSVVWNPWTWAWRKRRHSLSWLIKTWSLAFSLLLGRLLWYRFQAQPHSRQAHTRKPPPGLYCQLQCINGQTGVTVSFHSTNLPLCLWMIVVQARLFQQGRTL